MNRQGSARQIDTVGRMGLDAKLEERWMLRCRIYSVANCQEEEKKTYYFVD
jgi:hypothetical protein